MDNNENDLIRFKEDVTRICLEHTELNAINRRRINRLFEEIRGTGLEDVNRISELVGKIEKIITEHERPGYASGSKREIITREVGIYHKRKLGEYEVRDQIDKLVTVGTWGKSATKALHAYADALYQKRRREKQEEARRQREAELNKQDGKGTHKPVQETVSAYPRRPIVSEETKPTIKKETVIPPTKIEKVIEEKISEKLSGEVYIHFSLSAAERNAIRNAVGFAYDDRVLNALEKGTNLLQLKRKFEEYSKSLKNPFKNTYYTPSLDDVLKAATYVIDILPPELLAPNGSKEAAIANRLVANIEPDKCLENYATIYKIYSEYFSKLPVEEQAKVKAEFEAKLKVKFPKLGLDSFEIPSPDKVTNKVNSAVSKEMIEHRDRYAREKSQASTMDILKATKYMNSEQVASLYKQMKRDYESNFHSYNDGFDEERARKRTEYLETLQFNFARAILAKDVNRTLSAKEESESLKGICNDYFHEDASEFLTDIALIEQRKQIMVSKPHKDLGVFGINKMKDAFSKAKAAYGKYAQYDELEIMVTDRVQEQPGSKGNAK